MHRTLSFLDFSKLNLWHRRQWIPLVWAVFQAVLPVKAHAITPAIEAVFQRRYEPEALLEKDDFSRSVREELEERKNKIRTYFDSLDHTLLGSLTVTENKIIQAGYHLETEKEKNRLLKLLRFRQYRQDKAAIRKKIAALKGLKAAQIDQATSLATRLSKALDDFRDLVAQTKRERQPIHCLSQVEMTSLSQGAQKGVSNSFDILDWMDEGFSDFPPNPLTVRFKE